MHQTNYKHLHMAPLNTDIQSMLYVCKPYTWIHLVIMYL